MYRTIRSISIGQLQEKLMLRRMSLVGLHHIPMLVSFLNSTIVFLYFKDDSNNVSHAYAPASFGLVPTTANPHSILAL
jgi:hypothetical protein